MPRYKNVRARGHIFVFKYEEDCPELLHIYARHLKTDEDAIYIFFNGMSTWNSDQDCWETNYGNEGIWWFWIKEKEKVVMIISCFDHYTW